MLDIQKDAIRSNCHPVAKYLFNDGRNRPAAQHQCRLRYRKMFIKTKIWT